MGYNLLIDGVYWGYNLLNRQTSWDIQVGIHPVFIEVPPSPCQCFCLSGQNQESGPLKHGTWKTTFLVGNATVQGLH